MIGSLPSKIFANDAMVSWFRNPFLIVRPTNRWTGARILFLNLLGAAKVECNRRARSTPPFGGCVAILMMKDRKARLR